MVVKTSSSVRQDGFAYILEVNAARRQLRMSLSVIVVLAAGIVSAALTFGNHPIEAKRNVVYLPAVTTLHAETNPIGAVRS